VAVSRVPVVCDDAALALHYYPDWRVVDSSLCSSHFSRFSFSWLPKLRFDRDWRFCNRTRRWLFLLALLQLVDEGCGSIARTSGV
jgi:hypothetical protein